MVHGLPTFPPTQNEPTRTTAGWGTGIGWASDLHYFIFIIKMKKQKKLVRQQLK